MEQQAMPRRQLARQAAGYLVVGGIAAIVDIGLFHLLAPHFSQLAVPAVLSFLVAAVCNYSLSAVWVYQRNWRSWRRAGAFLFFNSIGLCVNAGVTLLLANSLPIPATLAKVGGVGVAFVVNFLMNTFIVFRRDDTLP